MKQRRTIAAVGFALVASVVAAACGGSSGDGSEGGTLRNFQRGLNSVVIYFA